MSTSPDASPARAPTDSLVQIRDLHFAFGSRVIYDGVSLDIPAGKVTAIMGPSGTGKTTLLRLIGGQWKAKSGSIVFDGTEIVGLGSGEMLKLRRKFGYLFQNGALLTDLSVFENVAFPIREHTDLPESMIRDLVLMKLEAVGLRGAQALFPDSLSGGMARRVAIARAIALDPMLMMYDEPFTGQDPISLGVLMRVIRTLNDSLGLTSVVVSHDVDEVLSIADHAYLLAGGKVLASGPPEALRASLAPQAVQFLKGHADGPVRFHYPAPDYAADLLAGAR